MVAMLNCACLRPSSSPVTPDGEKRVGPLITADAATRRGRLRAQATWSAMHGFATNPGPLVRPMTTNRAEATGSGSPWDRFSAMPMPLGHCGQLMSPPSTGPRSRGLGSAGTVMDGAALAVGVAAVLAGGDGVSDGATSGRDEAEGVAALSGFSESGASGASQPAPTRTATTSSTRPAALCTAPPLDCGARLGSETHRCPPGWNRTLAGR